MANSYPDMFSLEGKTVLVSGTNTGLGQGVCVAYAQAGANVIGVACRSCQETADGWQDKL